MGDMLNRVLPPRRTLLSRSYAPDAYAFINCAFCGDICSDLPLCESCETMPGQEDAVDRVIAAMPESWPTYDFHRQEIDEAKKRVATRTACDVGSRNARATAQDAQESTRGGRQVK